MTKLFSSQALPMLLRTLRARALPIGDLLSAYGLEPNAEEGFEISMALAAAAQLASACAVRANDPHFALHVAANAERGALGLMEFTVRTASTVREGLLQLCKFSALLNGLVTMELEETNKGARLTHRVEGDPQALRRQLNEFAIALLYRRALDVTDGTFSATRIQFAHTCETDVGSYRSVFGSTPIDFNAGTNALLFARSWLDRIPVDADRDLSVVLREQVRKASEERPETDSLRKALRAALVEELKERVPELPSVARRLAMGERTLQRKLSAEGTSFQGELEAVRESLARAFVRQGAKSLGEIGYLLRYSDLRAFSRAYKRWTGMSPSVAREQALAGQS